VRTYLRSLNPGLPRDVYVLQAGGLLNAFGNGVVLPFLIIYLHNVRGIPLGLAGVAAAIQSGAALLSSFAGGTLSDRFGPKWVLTGSLAVMTVAFALMPAIRSARASPGRSAGSSAPLSAVSRSSTRRSYSGPSRRA
jgi:MFS family permease